MPIRSEPRRPRIGHANRGRGLENLIQHTWEMYRRRGWGCGQKVATPTVQRRPTGPGDTGIRRQKSTVDFLGVYAGRPVAFDAKQTRDHSFRLDAVEEHQVAFLEDFAAAGGMGFLVIEFVCHHRIFAATPSWLFDTAEFMGRKSVPIDAFDHALGLGIGCWELREGLLGVPLHFGTIIEPGKGVPRGTGGSHA